MSLTIIINEQYSFDVLQMEIHKRKLNNSRLLKIQQEKSRTNKSNTSALSLSKIQNNLNQNSEIVNVDQSLLNDFQMLLNPNELTNQAYSQSKLIIQKQTFYRKYEDALVSMQIKNQQSNKRAFGILNSLALKMQKQPLFLGLIQYNILENLVLNLWKTFRQISFANSNTHKNSNLTQYLLTLQNLVKQRKIKDTKLGTLCLVIAKQLYENNQFVQSLQIADKAFKYCPRNRNVSLLLKIHYLKSKIFNKIQAFELQGQQIKKCIFFMNNLNQNVQKKQFGEQFLRMLINRKEELKKINKQKSLNKQKSVLFKEVSSKTNNNNQFQSQLKFRTKSNSFSRLKQITLNIQQNKMLKTAKNSVHKNSNQQKLQGETKKMFLKLDINYKSKLKKKTQTIWQKQTNYVIEHQKNNQKVRQQLQKLTYNNQLERFTQKINQKKQNYPIHLLLKRPTDKKSCLKIAQNKQSTHNLQQQNQLQTQKSAQLQLVQNNQNSQLVNSTKPQQNLKGLIRNLQTESLQKFILKNSIGFNKLEQWDNDSQQIVGQNQEIVQNQNLNKGKSSKFDYLSQQQLGQDKIEPLIFSELIMQQIICQKGILQIIQLQIKLNQNSTCINQIVANQNDYNKKTLVICSKIKLNDSYYKISLQFQLQKYSEKQVKLIIKSKQELYKWMITQNKQKQRIESTQQQIKQDYPQNNSLGFIFLDSFNKTLQELLTTKIVQNIKFQQKMNGKILKQKQKQQLCLIKKYTENQKLIKNLQQFKAESMIYQLRQKTFQFYQNQNIFKFKQYSSNQIILQSNKPKFLLLTLRKDQKQKNIIPKNKMNGFILIQKQLFQSQKYIYSTLFLIRKKYIFYKLHHFTKRIIRTNQKTKTTSIQQLNQQIQNFSQRKFMHLNEFQVVYYALTDKQQQFRKNQISQNQKQQKCKLSKTLKNNKQSNIFPIEILKKKSLQIQKANQSKQGAYIQKYHSFNIQNLVDSLLKKTLLQTQCQKSQIMNTYYQFITTSSIFRLSSQKCAFVNVKCFRMKNIYRKTQKDQGLYYLFQLQEQQTRTRMAKFIILQSQLKEFFIQNKMNCEQAYRKDSLCQVLKYICTYFVIKKNYIYSKIGLQTKNSIFYLANNFRIMKPLYTSLQYRSKDFSSNDIIKQIITKNIAAPNPQFITKQIKAKKIVCQKSILICSWKAKNQHIYQQHTNKTFFGILSVMKILQSNNFTIKVYLPYFQRSFSLNLTKQIIDYLSQDTLSFVFKDIQNLKIESTSKQNIIELIFQSQKQIQTKIWGRLIEIIKVEQKQTQHKNYLVVKIDHYQAFLKDSSCFDFFQIDMNIYQIQMTLEKTKKQDIHSPNNMQETINAPVKILNTNFKQIDNKMASNQKETIKQTKIQKQKNSIYNENNCFSKLDSIYQSQSSYFILYIRITQVFSNKQKNTLNKEQTQQNQQQKIKKNYKKKKQYKNGSQRVKVQQVQTMNISFYLSQLLSFLKLQSQNYSLEFSQNYYTQAELQNSFKRLKINIIQQFRQFSKLKQVGQKNNLSQLKQGILKRLNANYIKMLTQEHQSKQKIIKQKKFISLNNSRSQNFSQVPKYLNLSLLSNQKRKVISIFQDQSQLLYVLTNLRTFQVKKMIINSKNNSFPFLEILSQKNQLKSIHRRLFKYFKNKLQLY